MTPGNFSSALRVQADEAMAANKPDPVTSAITPDLGVVRQFIADMLARGAVVELVAAIVGLLARMRDLNTELMSKLAGKSRKRPPNESLRRLQLELPLFMTPPANDAEPSKPLEREKKKRGAKNPHRHGRPKLPAHLPRIPEVLRVPDALRTCPTCNVEGKTIGFKIVEKLDIKPAEFIVRQIQYETIACQKCHGYVCTCPKKDEVLDRGILGNDLLVEALVDHYDDAVPWERMARRAREQGVPWLPIRSPAASAVSSTCSIPSSVTSRTSACRRASRRSMRPACACSTQSIPSAFAPQPCGSSWVATGMRITRTRPRATTTTSKSCSRAARSAA